MEENAEKASSRKQKHQQRPRKEKTQQHTFSHELLASSLKVIRAYISRIELNTCIMLHKISIQLFSTVILINKEQQVSILNYYF